MKALVAVRLTGPKDSPYVVAVELLSVGATEPEELARLLKLASSQTPGAVTVDVVGTNKPTSVLVNLSVLDDKLVLEPIPVGHLIDPTLTPPAEAIHEAMYEATHEPAALDDLGHEDCDICRAARAGKSPTGSKPHPEAR